MYLLSQIYLLAFLRTLSTFGKFVMTSFLVFSVDQYVFNYNTNLSFSDLVIFIIYISRSCPGGHARFALFRTARQKDFSKCENFLFSGNKKYCIDISTYVSEI